MQSTNDLTGHPYEPMLAVSGIDHTVKVFAPDARSRWNARNGIGVSAADSSSFSSLEFGRRRRSTRYASSRRRSGVAAQVPLPPDTGDSDDDTQVTLNPPNGLNSRRRFHQVYQITSANDEEMRNENMGGAYISRSVLNQLVAHLRQRMDATREADEGDEEDEDGEGALAAQLFTGGECRVSGSIHLV